MMRKIEVCCSSVADVIEAETGGACRVELCSVLDVGGVTPSGGCIAQSVMQRGRLRIHVLIRPREGDFIYTPEEVATMVADIRLCRTLGVDGVVVGALTPDFRIDRPILRQLMDAAGSLSVTFHRAFDCCAEPFEAMEQIIEAGCSRILTSGQAATAELGLPLLSQLVERAAGRIIIMPASGITPQNIALIERQSGAPEFHASARRAVAAPVEGNSTFAFGANPTAKTHRDVVLQLCNQLV